jgi:hypothetical protein
LTDEGLAASSVGGADAPSGEGVAPLFVLGLARNGIAPETTMRIILMTGGLLILAAMPLAAQDASDSTRVFAVGVFRSA